MTTDNGPEQYDPEQTSSFVVGTLADSVAMDPPTVERSMTAPPVSGYVSPYNHGPGPSVVYQHSDGTTFSVADRLSPGASIEDPEDRLRELMIARALLRHALHLVDKELNGL